MRNLERIDRRLILACMALLLLAASLWGSKFYFDRKERIAAAELRAKRMSFEPVTDIMFDRYTCDDQGRLLAWGHLTKQVVTAGPVPRVAILRRLVVYSTEPRDIILDLTDVDLINRVQGRQDFAPFIPLKDMCGKSFEIHTVHTHPFDPTLELPQGWGPFGAGEDPGNKRLY